MASAQFINFLESLQQDLADNAAASCPFDPPYTTIDLGIVQGGTANNIIPEYTTVEWGFRFLPDENADQLQKRATDFIDKAILPPLKTRSALANVTTETTNVMIPLIPDDKSPAELLIRHLTGLNDSDVVSFGTEAGAFQNSGIPAVVFGPGSIKQAHQPDEFIEIDQLGQCIDFMHKLSNWAEGEAAQDLFATE